MSHYCEGVAGETYCLPRTSFVGYGGSWPKMAALKKVLDYKGIEYFRSNALRFCCVDWDAFNNPDDVCVNFVKM